MKLSNVSVKKLIKGACYFEEKDGFLFSYHYTKSQLDYFAPLDFWNTRSRFSAGIRLEMITEATELCFKMNVVCYGSDHSTVDLYVDDVAHAIHYIDRAGVNRVEFKMPEGKKKVTVYFPIDGEIGIKALSFNGGYKSAKDRRNRTLVIGDSITQGYGAVYAGASYINTLARLYNMEILNQAIGGYRYDKGGLERVEDFEHDRVLIALGTNYYNDAHIYDYETETVAFFERLNELFYDKKVVVCTPVWRRDAVKERFEWCIDIIKRECAKYGNITVIDGLELIPHLDEFYMPDGVHPNTYGMLTMAENLNRRLVKIKF